LKFKQCVFVTGLVLASFAPAYAQRAEVSGIIGWTFADGVEGDARLAGDGNLYDRVVFGYVRDMIYAFPNLHWSDLWKALPQMEVFPWIFNVADSLLCTGVGAMFVYTTFRKAPAPNHLAPAEVATK